MLLQPDDGERNPPPCGQPGSKVGTIVEKRPEPTVLEIRHVGGAITEMPWMGWDVVYAFICTEGLVGIRHGGRVILAAPHWSVTVWGRA